MYICRMQYTDLSPVLLPCCPKLIYKIKERLQLEYNLNKKVIQSVHEQSPARYPASDSGSGGNISFLQTGQAEGFSQLYSL